jgi:isopentenyl-diphosphate Delta-isomerase
MDEHIVLVDSDNNVLGTAPKLTSHNSNTPLHRAFSLFLFNSKGQLLLQQRSKIKKTWPLVWSNSCCGHPMLNETNKDAAKRRLKDELGITINKVYEILPDFSYKAEMNGIIENEICPVFVGFSDFEPVINKDEVEKVKWINWKEFVSMINSGKNDFSIWANMETKELSQNKKFQDLYEKLTD